MFHVAMCALFMIGPRNANPVRPPLRGPLVVVMLKEGCPCVRECRTQLNAMAGACRGKIRLVGVVDGDEAKASALQKDAGLVFPILADPNAKTIRALGGHAALDLRLVGRDGKVAGKWDGLSRANVAALVEAVGRTTGKDVSLGLEPFTVLTKIGCAFDPWTAKRNQKYRPAMLRKSQQ